MVGMGGLFVSPEVLKEMPLVMQLVLKQSAVTGGVTLLVLYALLGQDKVPVETEEENRLEQASSPIHGDRVSR
jgi:xanthine/uracil permease